MTVRLNEFSSITVCDPHAEGYCRGVGSSLPQDIFWVFHVFLFRIILNIAQYYKTLLLMPLCF